MSKTLKTRIKNRYDSLTNWSKTGVELLQGEIALVKVETQQIDQATGDVVTVPAFLMKVGENDANGTPKAFSTLPWLSALAADVYDWAKVGAATDVPVTVNGTASTLGAYLTKVNTNASNISAVSTKVDVDKVSTAISTAVSNAIKALDSTSSGTGTFVKAVSQTDGKVTVTMGTIAESELPNISTDKVYLASATSTTLTSKLSTMDAAIGAVETKLDGVTKVTTSISNAIAALDVSEPSASGTSTSFIATAKQTDGKIVVTKKNLPTASTSVSGIAKLGASGGAATYDSVFGTDGLSSKVTKNTADIDSLKTSVAGGVHFRGTVSAEPSATTTTVNNVTISTGDVVIYSGKEYICTAVTDGKPSWEQLGDVTRIGNLETKVNNLDYAGGSFGTSKFATKVTQTDGKIAVEYAQPASTDITHSGSTVSAALGGHDSRIEAVEAKLDGVTKVTTSITNALGALDVSDPTASGTSTSFIATASQTDGKISVTKKNLPTASTSAKGIVQLNVSGGAAKYDDFVTLKDTTVPAIDARVTANTNAITKLNGDSSTTGSVAKAVADAINALDFTSPSASSTTTAFIDTVSQTNGKISATKKTITSATTSTAGIVKLSSSVTSTSETLAATPKAVSTVNTKAENAQSRAGAIEANYVRVGTGDKLVHYVSGTDYEIILDCGGAE
jgi:hypothetical protein